MKKTWMVGGVVLSVAIAGGAGAQSQTASSQGTITMIGCLQQGGSAAGTTGSVGTSGTTGATATGSTGSSASSGPFVLMNARAGMGSGSTSAPGSVTSSPGAPPTTSAPAPSGTAGAPSAGDSGSAATSGAAGTAGTMYILQGQDAALRQHIGHQVEVTGRLASGATTSATGASIGATSATGGAATSGAATPGSTPATGTSSASGTAATSAANAPRIDVQSIRMVASNCQASGSPR